MTELTITPGWIERVLALPTPAEQATEIARANLANEPGLQRILDYADAAARSSPGQAAAITELCQAVAATLGIVTISPRAQYIRAQTYSLQGRAADALALIESARDEFNQLGLTVEALRTEAGRIHAYTMLGDYGRAIETGQNALTEIENTLNTVDAERTAALQMIRGKLYVNLGPPLSESGRFAETLDTYTQAETIFATLQRTDDLAYVMNNRGVTLRYLGRIDEALAAYQQAFTASQQTSGYFYALLQTNIGDAQLLLGDYQSSLQAYNRAREEFAGQGLVEDEQIAQCHMADAYLALNLFPEALELYQAAAAVLQRSAFTYFHGKAMWGIGIAQCAVGNFSESSAALQQAADLFRQLANIPLLASVLLEQAALHQAQDNHADALTLTQQALHDLDTDERNGWPVQQIYAHLRMADLLLDDLEQTNTQQTNTQQTNPQQTNPQQTNIEQIETHLQQAASRLDQLPMPHLRYRLLLRQAQLRRAQQRMDEAQSLLETALDVIEQLRASLASEIFRISFQQDKMGAYEALIALHLEQTSSDQALAHTFDLIERTKSRALVERLSGMMEEFPPTQNHAVTAKREEIQSRLNAIYSELLGQETGDTEEPEARGDRTVRLAQLSQQASALESELTQIRLQSNLDGQIHGDAQPLRTQQIQQQLAPDVRLISYHVAGDEILAFVVAQHKIRVVRNIGHVDALHRHLTQLHLHWQQFRNGQRFLARHLPRLEQHAQQIFHQLYRLIFEPLETLLANEFAGEEGLPQQIVIAPYGPLHQVPFHALFDGQRYLVERFAFSYTPSATLYTLCQQQRLRPSKAVSVFAVSDPAIPAVAAESHAIRNALPQSTVFLNEDARVDAFSTNAAHSRILHLACHGLYRTDNPSYSALKLHDGWLTAVQLAEVDLTGALVVLSACESGRGAVLAGDEMIGLMRACLSAGANALIASQWLVQDDTGAMLMAEWYARIARGQRAAAALRAAQLALHSSHPHPYYWAPFILVGRRGKLF
ncbi:MAG: CHAT domain-containing protein [Caldilineaceae bacterium]|nr:CHAT domain-containing protein [Caldilineaceae bacterium]